MRGQGLLGLTGVERVSGRGIEWGTNVEERKREPSFAGTLAILKGHG
jgi:hypothetical protein